MKRIFILIFSCSFSQLQSQAIVGTWQITRQTNCLEQEVSDTTRIDEKMLNDFSSRSTYATKVITFKTDNSGEEILRNPGKKRASTVKKFHYKAAGEHIYFLDKKSHLIVSGVTIETLTSDSLVYYTAGKECEKTFLIRAK